MNYVEGGRNLWSHWELKAGGSGQQHGPGSHGSNPSMCTEALVDYGSLWSKHAVITAVTVTIFFILNQGRVHPLYYKHKQSLRLKTSQTQQSTL